MTKLQRSVPKLLQSYDLFAKRDDFSIDPVRKEGSRVLIFVGGAQGCQHDCSRMSQQFVWHGRKNAGGSHNVSGDCFISQSHQARCHLILFNFYISWCLFSYHMSESVKRATVQLIDFQLGSVSFSDLQALDIGSVTADPLLLGLLDHSAEVLSCCLGSSPLLFLNKSFENNSKTYISQRRCRPLLAISVHNSPTSYPRLSQT